MSNLLFLDLETTGFDTQKAEIIEIAFKTDKLYSKLFKPTEPIPYDVSGITNIDNFMVKDCAIFNKLSIPMPIESPNYTIICHNADYDLEILKRYGLEFKNYICTYRLAWWFYPTLPNHKLGTLRAFFEIPPLSHLHRATADTELLEKIFNKILKDKDIRIEEAIEVTQIADKEFYSIWNFGKHKGEKIHESQNSYIRWALSNINDLHPKFKSNLEKYV